MKKYDAVIAGYTCVDMIPEFRRSGESVDYLQLFMPGKLVEIDGMTFTLGGAVPNTGLAMKKFGMNVYLNGLVGEDVLGKMVWEWLDKYHVAQGIQATPKSGTAFSIVLAPPGIDRIFLESPGCNQVFNLDHINFEVISQSRLFHFGYPPLLRNFYLEKGKQLVNLFSRIQNLGVVTSLDFSLPDPNSESGKMPWPEIMSQVLAHTDVFVPSLEELFRILQPQEFENHRSLSAGGDILDTIPVEKISELGKKVIEAGVKIVLVKAGHRGIYLITGDASSVPVFKLSSRKWNHIELWCDAYKAETKKIRNSSGAGDTAAAAFLTALLKGESPDLAIRYAALAGRNNLYCTGINDLDNWTDMTEEIKYTENEITYLNKL